MVSAGDARALEPVIGLEIHVQLKTATKLFCGDLAEYGAQPNTHVCPVCLGLPGALPVVNERAVELAVRAALGLGCEIHESSIFARKNYFYPDLPKGYQVTQFERPLATGGWLDVTEEDGGSQRVRMRRVHLEEDAGKSIHDRYPGLTAVDLNRAGVPLIEVVTEPDLRSPSQARGFLGELKQLLRYLDVSDCDMEKGSLRVDANVSVRPAGAARLGTRTEVKNMNSFSAVERALAYEIERQSARIAAGGDVVHETLLWDEDRGQVRPMRSKEESHDYRYFPEPDLPPLVIEPERVRALRATLPERPAQRRHRLLHEHGLSPYDVGVLTAEKPVADYFEAVARAADDAKAAANWVMTEVLAWSNREQRPVTEFPVEPPALAELIGLVRAGTLSSTLGRSVLEKMIASGRGAREIVEAEALTQVGDEARLETWADEVVAGHPQEVERYRGGETKLLGFFMGRLMETSAGRADPRKAKEILRARLEA